MNQTQQLKLLDDEIRRLFSEGVNENDAFDQLSTDQRFETVRRSSVQSLYKELQKNQEEEVQKQKLEERKRQLDEESERMIQYSQKAKDLLLFEGPIFDGNNQFMNVWQNRYFVTEKRGRQINNTRVLNFHDLLQNVSKEVSFCSVNCPRVIHTLNENFIIIDEFQFPFKLVRLAQVNLSDGTLQMIQAIENYNILSLIVDSSNLSKFILLCHSEDGANSIVICKLVAGKIEFGAEIVLENLDSFGDACTYFNDQLFVFEENLWTKKLSNATITIQDLNAEKKSKRLKLEPLPSNIYDGYVEAEVWSGDHFFISIQFRSTDEDGIAFTNPQTCKWTVLEFLINPPIRKLLIVNKCDLLVYAKERRSESNDYLHNFYKLPMRKPELLRYKAWTKTVKLFKKKQAVDPYEQARQYLPLNSDIRGHFAADQNDDE